jgi:hypothetical protein
MRLRDLRITLGVLIMSTILLLIATSIEGCKL